jgi:hypothetical protein
MLCKHKRLVTSPVSSPKHFPRFSCHIFFRTPYASILSLYSQVNSCCSLPWPVYWGFYSGRSRWRRSSDSYLYSDSRSDPWIPLGKLGILSKDHSAFVGIERLEDVVSKDACNLTSLQSEVAIRWGKGELLL